MYRKYYSYSDMPQMVQKKETAQELQKSEMSGAWKKDDKRLIGGFEADDLLLLVILIALIFDEGADDSLILALCFVFLTGLAL